MAVKKDVDWNILYGCQIKVPRFGKKSQKQLARMRCAIIGMGGLGCPVAQYLAASGIGELTLYDTDYVDPTSICRQVLYTFQNFNQLKVHVAALRLQELNPFVRIIAKDIHINESNWKKELEKQDVIIDCTDNYFSKYLLHDASRVLGKKLVQAGIYQTSGQVLYFNFATRPRKNSTQTSRTQSRLSKMPCLRCLWSESSFTQEVDCEQSGVLTTVAGTVGLMQANTALHALLDTGKHLESTIQIFDWEQLEWETIALKKNKQCVCASDSAFMKHVNYLYYPLPFETSTLPPVTKGKRYILIDVRNEEDQKDNVAYGTREVITIQNQYLLHIEEFAKTLDKNMHYIIFCYKGRRSFSIAKQLRKLGIMKVQSLVGGYAKLVHLHMSHAHVD